MKKGRLKRQASFYATEERLKEILETAQNKNLSFSNYLIVCHEDKKKTDEGKEYFRTRNMEIRKNGE